MYAHMTVSDQISMNLPEIPVALDQKSKKTSESLAVLAHEIAMNHQKFLFFVARKSINYPMFLQFWLMKSPESPAVLAHEIARSSCSFG